MFVLASYNVAICNESSLVLTSALRWMNNIYISTYGLTVVNNKYENNSSAC